MKTLKGSCLCGGVRFTGVVPKDDTLYYCHCKQCRKNYGLYSAAVGIPRADFKITKGKENISVFSSSKGVERNFCSVCGSPILWDRKRLPKVYVLAGLIDGKVGVQKKVHIFTKYKGDYYDICDGHPQYKIVPK